MAKISHILLKDPIVVPTGTKVRDAARLMKLRKISSVLISRDGILAGIISAEDIVNMIADRADVDIVIDEMMHSPKISIDSEKWLSDAIIMFDRCKDSYITVIEHGENVGIIRSDDVLHTYRFNKQKY